jgi:2'-5' RNA ligase
MVLSHIDPIESSGFVEHLKLPHYVTFGSSLQGTSAQQAGARIQAWRERHDPEQARRLPPHMTLCYWAPTVEPDLLERQVRHAFDRPVAVRLGSVHEFDNKDCTFYVEVLGTAGLDAARARLYDGAFLELPVRPEWTWHVTCVRYGVRRDLAELRRLVTELDANANWQVGTIAYLELRGDRYEPLAEWRVTG